jgi:hypothetical protein
MDHLPLFSGFPGEEGGVFGVGKEGPAPAVKKRKLGVGFLDAGGKTGVCASLDWLGDFHVSGGDSPLDGGSFGGDEELVWGQLAGGDLVGKVDGLDGSIFDDMLGPLSPVATGKSPKRQRRERAGSLASIEGTSSALSSVDSPANNSVPDFLDPLLPGAASLVTFTVPWTEEEDGVIRHGVADKLSWPMISQQLITRSSTQCSQRWRKVLDPSIKRFVKWTKEEDATLVRLHKEHRTMSNKKMAGFLPGRTPTQCHNRWVEVLNPDIRRGPFTQAEDERLLELRGTGMGWSAISKEPEFFGRANVSLKNRWRTLERRRTYVKKKPPKPAASRKVVDPRRRRWMPEEDALLLKLHQEHPEWSSKEISLHFPTRTLKQCHSRWMECLNPEIRRGPFSKEEDALLMRLRGSGKGWADMVQDPVLKNRSYTACKNRYRSIMRERKREKDRAEKGRTSQPPKGSSASLPLLLALPSEPTVVPSVKQGHDDGLPH